MKKKLLLMATILVASVSAMAQKSYTFNAVALNVDGLPETISGVTVNEGAPGASGATTMGNAIAKENWGIVGFSEDFDYHESLVAPLTDYYHVGTWRGEIDLGITDIILQNSADTDGLGLLVAKRDDTGYSNEKYVQWSTYNGYTDQGADGLIKKGFRYYAVTIASGIVVDVYILHMDADSGTADIEARNSQLTQLATYIKNNHNGRPVIIIGDTNCRYTRDALKTNLIDAINADSRLTIKDAWVELMWGGTYPELGADAMMWYNAPYNNNTGEVVDKIFYINTTESNLTLKANSYLHDTDFGVSDHYPVIVNFTITNPNGTPSEPEFEEPEDMVLTDSDPTDPTSDLSGTFYLRNVASGLYLKAAGSYGSHASEGVHAMPMTLNKVSSTSYYITHTITGFYLGNNCFLDNGTRADWRFKEITRSDGVKKYVLLHPTDNTALSSFGDGNVDVAAYDAVDTKQQWMLYTADMIRGEMPNTPTGGTYNASTLIPYGRVDTHHDDTRKSEWQGTPGFTEWSARANHSMEKHFWANETQTFDVYQSITGLPAGTYTLTAQAFHRSGDHGTSVTTVLPDLYATNGSSTTTVKICSINDASAPATKPNSMHEAGDAFLAGAYNVTLSNITVGSDGELRIGIRNTSSDNSARLWCCFNNFQLLYHGTSVGDLRTTEVYKSVKAAAESTLAKVKLLNSPEALAAFDISAVVYRYDNGLISADGLVEMAMIDEAYETSFIVYKNTLVENAFSSMGEDGDVTGAIINPSFETGDLFGWTIENRNGDLAVHQTSDAVYSISGSHGDYMFNAWDGDANHTTYIKQTINGLPNGLYELKAVLASFGTADGKDHDYHVYLTGNDYHTSVAAVGGKTVGQEVTLYFLVEGGSATIGAIGGNKGGGTEFIHYWPWEGSFIKADNFRLKYICDVPNGRLKLALNEVDAAGLDFYGQKALDISAYETMYANKSVTGDGTTEAEAVYAALNTASKAQMTVGANMTWAIENPSFETGDYTGWTCETGGDTQAASQENGTYSVAGTNGRYMFNTWNNGTAVAVTQTVSGLPNGTYKLTAMVATDAANSMNLTANGTTTTIAASTNGGSSGVFPEVQCEVTDGTLAIEVVGVNDVWYKCDDFRLTLVAPADLVFEETATEIVPIEGVTYPRVTLNRTIKPNTWSTFVSPFDIPASVLDGWDVKELSSATENAGHVSLIFTNSEDGIKKGVPYMVRNASLGENLTAITMENVEVNTVALTEVEGGAVTFVGQYINKNVPEGDFFISSNTFYQAEDNTNTMKGFRARLVPTSAGVKSIGYSFDDVDFTGIEGVEDNAAEIVAIYGVDGTLRSDLQKGINIVKMSNGATKKVLVK